MPSPDSLDDFDSADALRVYNINALGVIRVLRAVKPKLKAGSKVVNISSQMGSKGEPYGCTYFAHSLCVCVSVRVRRLIRVCLRDVQPR